MTSKDEEKAEVLNAFLTSAFNQKPSCPLHIQPPELEERNKEQNEGPTLQEEVVSELLCCPDMHKSGEMPSFPIRLWRELAKQLAMLLSPSFITGLG